MGLYRKYTPYSESPTIRTTTQPVSGGIVIDTSTAQGVSVKSLLNRRASILPLIGAGNSDFSMDCLNFASSEATDPGVPFTDRAKVSAKPYLQDPTQFGSNIVVGDYLPLDGAIEPLTIRDAAAFTSIEDPISHRARGTIMGGNEDPILGSDMLSSFFPYAKNSDFVPFLDSADAIGTTQILGLISDPADDKIIAYDDSILDTRFLSTNSNINVALLSMTGSSDDDFRPLNSKSATSGFVYGNKEGTDSLAFGGLKK